MLTSSPKKECETSHNIFYWLRTEIIFLKIWKKQSILSECISSFFFFSLGPSVASRRLKLLMWLAHLLFLLNNAGQDFKVARELLGRKGHCEWKIRHAHGVGSVTVRLELCLLTHCPPHIVRLWTWASVNPSSSNLGAFNWPVSSQSQFVEERPEGWTQHQDAPGLPVAAFFMSPGFNAKLLRNPISPVLCWHWALPSDIWILKERNQSLKFGHSSA